MSNVNENVNDEFEKMLAETEQKVAKIQPVEDKPVNYLMLVKPLSKILVKSSEIYNQNAKIDGFYCSKDTGAFNFSEELRVVPIAFLHNYIEKEVVGTETKYFSKWRGDEVKALAKRGEISLAEGSFYDYALPNGHLLEPVDWVCVHLVDYPEIDDAVIAYKKQGSKIFKNWLRDSEERAKVSSTLVYKISSIEQSNKANKTWTDIGFEFEESLAETDRQLAVECMKKANQIVDAYTSGTLITNKALALKAPIQEEQEVLPDASDVDLEEAFDEEDFDEGVTKQPTGEITF